MLLGLQNSFAASGPLGTALALRDTSRMHQAIDWMAKRGRGVIGEGAYMNPIFDMVSSGGLGQLASMVQLLGMRTRS